MLNEKNREERSRKMGDVFVDYNSNGVHVRSIALAIMRLDKNISARAVE